MLGLRDQDLRYGLKSLSKEKLQTQSLLYSVVYDTESKSQDSG